jgi:uncharacterized protein (UPF0332 family)
MMRFDWTDFLTFAEALQLTPDSPGPPEAALRSAASRAYYAAFHHALDLACKEGFGPSFQASDHKQVQDHFRNCKPPDRIRQKIARELERLCDQRRQADYDAVLHKEPVSLAAHAIGMARSVLGNLNSLVDN